VSKRCVAIAVPILAAAACCAVTPAAAIWCANYSNGSTNCGFYTFDQCRAAISGVGGSCTGSDSGRNAEKPASRKVREAEPKPKRKERERERETPVERHIPPPAAAQPALAPPTAVQPPTATAQQPANNFQSARALIAAGRYEAGIAAMKSLGYDDHPDIASAIGFANAQLGRYAEARKWYERALVADPNHLVTLNYSGALHVAQNELDQARTDLARIKTVCGGGNCPEYQQLDRLIASKAR